LAVFSQNFVSIQKVLHAMIGMGDWTLGLVVSFILIPLGLLWGVS
jgi:hypothetical protein